MALCNADAEHLVLPAVVTFCLTTFWRRRQLQRARRLPSGGRCSCTWPSGGSRRPQKARLHPGRHYQSKAFSRNGLPTIVSRVSGVEVRGVEQLSTMDIHAIDRVYARGGAGPGGGPPPLLGGLGIPLPGWPPANLPLPGGTGSLPSLPQWGGLQDAAGTFRLPWQR